MGLNKMIVVSHLPPGSIVAPEATGFASINPSFPKIESDPRIVQMVRLYNARVEEFERQEAMGNDFAGDSAQELITHRQEYFASEIINWYGSMVNTKDVDFLEVVEIPLNWSYQVLQGRSGYEELIIWETGSNKISIYNPGA